MDLNPTDLLRLYKAAEIRQEYLERTCRIWIKRRAVENPPRDSTLQRLNAYQVDLDTIQLNLDIITEKFFEETQNRIDFTKLLGNIAK